MNIIFQVEGGIGKSVAATGVCKAIKKQYPNDQLIVITGYPEVFLCNPGMKVFNFNDMRYFYDQYVKGQEVKIFAHNPYLESAFVMEQGHLIKVWCEMFGIKYDGELPELFINNREQTFYGNQIVSDKPIMVIQTNGGGANQSNKYSWTRDLPIATAQKVVNAFANEYTIVHIRRDDQLALHNTATIKTDFRGYAVLIQLSEKRLFIDSFGQHTASALSKPSVVCWIGNIPSQFGYEMHTNIIAHQPTIQPELRYSVLSKYNIIGTPTEFPYHHEAEIFDADEIIAALKADKKPIIKEEKQEESLNKKKKPE